VLRNPLFQNGNGKLDWEPIYEASHRSDLSPWQINSNCLARTLNYVETSDSTIHQMVELLKQGSDFDTVIANLETVGDILGKYRNSK
jgi:hypothetical protein